MVESSILSIFSIAYVDKMNLLLGLNQRLVLKNTTEVQKNGVLRMHTSLDWENVVGQINGVLVHRALLQEMNGLMAQGVYTALVAHIAPLQLMLPFAALRNHFVELDLLQKLIALYW